MLWVMYTTLDYTSILPERTLNRNPQNCRYPVLVPDNSWGGTLGVHAELRTTETCAQSRSGGEFSSYVRKKKYYCSNCCSLFFLLFVVTSCNNDTEE